VRPLLFFALAVTFVGCTCFAPQQMQQVALTGCTETTGAACPDGAADMVQPNANPRALQDHPTAKTGKTATVKKANLRHRKEVNTRIQNKRSNIAAGTDASSGQQHDKSNTISAQLK
jgi:hypothetical protein